MQRRYDLSVDINGVWDASYFEVLPRDTVMDFGGAPDLSGAMAQARGGESSAIQVQDRALEDAKTQVAPWWRAGKGAVEQEAGLLGLSGYTALDPTTTLKATPGYQFLQDEGTKGIARQGAATGFTGSGVQMKGAADYAQNLALNKAWTPYMSALQGLSGQGLQAGVIGAQAALQTGANEAKTYQSTGDQLSKLYQQQAIYDAQNQNSMWNQIAGGVGLAAGIATGNPGLALGGLSNLGTSAMDWFGNASGSYMPATTSDGMSLGQMSAAGNKSFNAYDVTSGGNWVPWYADGGSISAGQPAVIGERGPEVFVPKTDGYVVPNYALGGPNRWVEYAEEMPFKKYELAPYAVDTIRGMDRKTEYVQPDPNAFAPWRN
jgi:hypothetical protein